MEIRNKTFVVTGAGRGIGRAVSCLFAKQGAHVALLDRNGADALRVARECSDFGSIARAYEMDVSSESDVSGSMDKIVRDFGALDVIVNNAGILRDGLLLKIKDDEVVGKMSLAQFQMVIDVNLTGVFLCAREAAERMVKLGRGGVIINISSISRHGNIGQSNYSAAKSGVQAMSVVWAKELARFGIRVGSIAPGFVRTDLLDSMNAAILEKVITPVPLKRLGKPEEIAHAVQFIIENDFFTGRCIDLDGGLRL